MAIFSSLVYSVSYALVQYFSLASRTTNRVTWSKDKRWQRNNRRIKMGFSASLLSPFVWFSRVRIMVVSFIPYRLSATKSHKRMVSWIWTTPPKLKLYSRTKTDLANTLIKWNAVCAGRPSRWLMRCSIAKRCTCSIFTAMRTVCPMMTRRMTLLQCSTNALPVIVQWILLRNSRRKLKLGTLSTDEDHQSLMT